MANFRVASRVTALVVLLAGCGSAVKPAVTAAPTEFAAACGHPGAVVELRRVPVTVRHAQCDLTGVILRYRGIGVTVPVSGGAMAQADGPAGGHGLTASVDPATQDVSIVA